MDLLSVLEEGGDEAAAVGLPVPVDPPQFAREPIQILGRAVGGALLVAEDVIRGAGLPEVTVAEVGGGRVGGGGGRAFLLELQGDVRAVVDEDRAVDVLGRGGAVRIEDLADPAVLVVVGVLDIT